MYDVPRYTILIWSSCSVSESDSESLGISNNLDLGLEDLFYESVSDSVSESSSGLLISGNWLFFNEDQVV